MKPLILSLILLSLSACTTVEITKHPYKAGTDIYGPVNDEDEWGIARYLIAYADSIANARKQELQKMLYDYCDGKYETRPIVLEHYTQTHVTYAFRCVK